MQRFPSDACLITCMLHRLVGFGGDGFPDTQAVGVVGVADRYLIVRPVGVLRVHGCQLPAMFPGVVPGAVTQRIADGVVGNGVSVVCRQQIPPGAVAVGVGYRGEDGAKRAGGVNIPLELLILPVLL